MEGQSSVNIFDINKKRNQPGVQTNGASLQSQNSYISSNSNTYTREMEKLDKELETEGLKIERLSDEEKLNYVNSLTDSEYERLTQYRDAGYSFGSAKALVDLEKQINTQRGTSAGGYRGNLYQEQKPISSLGKTAEKVENVIDTANYRGKLMEMLDNWVQEVVVPAMTVTKREERSQALTEKYNNMTQEDRDKLLEEYKNDPKAKNFVDDTLQENLDYYWKQKNKNFWDELRGADINTKTDVNGKQVATPTNLPSTMEALANIPVSALANASAVARGMTNPFDNTMLIAQLLGTKEGRQMLAYRYLDEQGRNESIEKDPVSWILDIFDLGSLFTNLTSKAVRLTSGAERMIGATTRAERTSRFASKLENISRKMDNIADMGISEKYNQLLNKELNKLSEGNKMANMIGDYLSLTQRPLGTIRAGANPTNEKGEQVVQPGDWTYEGLQKPISNILEGMKEKIRTSATGLTPEVRERIRQNPYIKQYWERVEAMIEDEGLPMDNQKIMEGPIEEVGNELLRRLDEYESQLQENGREYQVLDSITRPFNISEFMSKIFDIFDKNGITITKDGLEFRTTANPADMNPINVAWNLIKAKEPKFQSMTIKEIREFRQQLRSLLKYHSDAPSTKYSKRVLKQLIDGAFNGIVHKEIPELAKVDEIYSKQIDELDEFRDGLVYQIGEKKGQIKDNFYSIISTMNTQNRQKMKERLERIFPDLGARVEAIRMLPTIAKAVQSSPQMMKALFQKAGFLGGLKQSGGIKRAIMGWLLGIVADELFAKPLGEKWRNRAINELINEVSPEAMAKLQEIKSKVDAGVELSEQEKRDLASALQQIAIREYQYLDEKHQKAFAEMMEGLNNPNPALPGTMDTIGPDGKIQLQAGKQVNNPEDYKPKTREERVQQIQEEYQVDEATAEEMTNTVEDFLDDIGGDINGNVSPREVKYDRFSTKSLEKLMDDPDIPESEKTKIVDILVRRGVEVDERSNLDQEFAYRINKLTEEEQRVGKVGKNKVDRSVAQKQQADLEKKREALKVEMRERYAGQGVDLDSERADEKYNELRGKPIEYINEYKKSKGFREEQAEREVLNRLKEERKKQPKFIRDMDDNMAGQRQNIVDQKLGDGYERSTTEYGDVFKNKETGGKGAIKYNNDGTITVAMNEEAWDNSGIRDILPEDTLIRFEGDSETIPLKEIRSPEYQTVGRANPNQKTVSAEEGWNLKSFKGDKTIGDLADEYGLKRAIVDKIFTAEGEEALGRTKGDLIELVREVKEGTPGHETFHGIFNIVNKKRRQEIIDLVMKHKGMTEAQAKEWLADSFSEYFSTGKFDTKPIPKGFVNKVKWFFKQVKDFINGTWRSRKKIQKLFDDIMENKIDRQAFDEMVMDALGLYNDEYSISETKNDSLLHLDSVMRPGRPESRITGKLTITDQNASQIINELNNLREYTKTMEPEEFINSIKSVLTNKGDSNYLKNERFDSPYYLRIGDHPMNERNSAQRGQYDNVTSAVVQLINSEYKRDPRVNAEEFIYPKEALTQEKMEGFLDGIIDRINTGKFTDIGWSKKNPLTIDDNRIFGEYQLAPQQKSLFDQKPEDTKLEAYFKEKPYNIDIMYKTYDPDIVEWMNNIKKKFVGGEDITMNELYEVKNMIDEHSKDKGTQIDVPDGPTAELLLEKVESMAKNKIGTYETKQIEKIGGDAEEILRRINDVTGRWYNNFNDVKWNDVPEKKGEMIYDLGETYDPDIDKRYDKFMKKLTSIEGLKDYNKKNIQKSGLQNLKAKVQEMERIGIDNFGDIWEDDLLGIFVDGIKEGINKTAKKGEKAVQQLVALHNLKLEHFEEQVKGKAFGGKSPMPSIAVGDPNVPHEAFGDITLVFGRDTIDPKVDKANKLYGSDAWTPMFPDVKEVRKSGKKGVLALHEAFDSDLMQKEFTEIMSEFGIPEGKEGIIWDLAHDVNHYRLDLQDLSGKELTDKIDHLANKIAKINFKGYNLHWFGPEPSNAIQYQWYEKNAVYNKIVDKIKEIYTEASNDTELVIPARYFDKGAMGYLNVSKGLEVAEELSKMVSDDIVKEVIDTNKGLDRLPNKPETRADVEKYYQSLILTQISDVVQMIEDFGIKPWNAKEELLDFLKKEADLEGTEVDNLVSEIFGNGIAGARPLTPENILEAMKNQKPNRTVKVGEFKDMIQKEGHRLDSVDKIRNQNFARMYHNDWIGDISDLEKRYNNIVDTLEHEYASAIKTNKMIDRGIKQSEVRHVIKKSYDPDIQKFKEKFKKNAEGWNSIPPDDILQRIIDVVEQGKKVPIRFAESKPERVVNLFDEVQYVIAPRWERQKVKEIVEGTPLEDKVHYYNYGEGSRASVIKNLQKKYGNIFFSMGGVVMPIAMLLMMMQGEDDQGEGQQA